MPIYNYRGVDRTGRTVTGVMEAPDDVMLEDKLKNIGFWLVEAQPQAHGTLNLGLLLWGRVKRQDLIDFCTQLSSQTKAGVPLIQSLQVAVDECENPRFKLILEGILRNIEAGSLFYEALEKYPEAFSEQVISLVRAGEMSGRLAETFQELRKYYEWLERTMSDVRQASIYPTIVVSVVAMFVLFLFTYIIPKFELLLTGLKVQLPGLTVAVFGLSDFAKATWWIWVSAVLVATVGMRLACRFSQRIAFWHDQMKLRVPGFGELNHMIALTRFTRNLALMYRSGIPILQALHLCRGLVGNVVMEHAIREVEQSVASGDTISEALGRHKIFPSFVIRMVLLGESTGNLDESLETASDYYNEVIPRRIKRLFTLMEPALMLVLIFIVGTVALSIFLPLISLMGGIQR